MLVLVLKVTNFYEKRTAFYTNLTTRFLIKSCNFLRKSSTSYRSKNLGNVLRDFAEEALEKENLKHFPSPSNSSQPLSDLFLIPRTLVLKQKTCKPVGRIWFKHAAEYHLSILQISRFARSIQHFTCAPECHVQPRRVALSLTKVQGLPICRLRLFRLPPLHVGQIVFRVHLQLKLKERSGREVGEHQHIPAFTHAAHLGNKRHQS